MLSWTCDGIEDCLGGDDEVGCSPRKYLDHSRALTDVACHEFRNNLHSSRHVKMRVSGSLTLMAYP